MNIQAINLILLIYLAQYNFKIVLHSAWLFKYMKFQVATMRVMLDTQG